MQFTTGIFRRIFSRGVKGFLLASGIAGAAIAQPYSHLPDNGSLFSVNNGIAISPQAALAAYDVVCSGSPVDPSLCTGRSEVGDDALVQSAARNLGYDVNHIFGYLASSVRAVPQFGLHSGAGKVLIEQQGTPFDIAQAFYLLLKESDSSGGTSYNPEIVLGQIAFTDQELADWLGTTTTGEAYNMLVSGGIPAEAVTGGVRVLHVFVRVNIGGTVHLLDASVKPGAHLPPPDIAAGVPSPLVTWRQYVASRAAPLAYNVGISKTTTFSHLGSIRGALDGYILSNFRGQRAEALLGSRHVVRKVVSDVASYSIGGRVTEHATWLDGIPKILTARVHVRCSNLTEGIYYAADDYYIKHIPLACSGYGAEVALDHPYPAANWTYQDSRSVKPPVGNARLIVTWGGTSPGLISWLSQRQARNYEVAGGPNVPLFMIDFEMQHAFSAALSGFISLVDAVEQSDTLIHHTALTVINKQQSITTVCITSCVGVDSDWQVYTFQPNIFTSLENFMLVDFKVAATTSGDLAKIGFLGSMGVSFAESATIRNYNNTDRVPDALSTATVRNALGVDATQFTLLRPANLSTLNAMTSYPLPFRTYVSDFISMTGGSALLPSNGSVPLSTYFIDQVETGFTGLTVEKQYTDSSTSAAFLVRPDGSLSGLVSFNEASGLILKAGAGPIYQDKLGQSLAPLTLPDASEKRDYFQSISVSGQDGSLTLTPAPDLVDGTGAFPESLSLQRRYNSADYSESGFGTGWSHNWDHKVVLASDAGVAYGKNGVHGMSAGLAAVLALSEGWEAAPPVSGAHSIGQLATGLYVVEWLVQQTVDNRADVVSGLDGSESFLRQEGGSFVSESASEAVLTMSGSTGYSKIERRTYNTITFNLVTPDGQVRTYNQINAGIIPHSDYHLSILSRPEFHLDQWTFPDGVLVSADHQYWTEDGFVSLQRVSNSFGREIELTLYDPGTVSGLPYCDNTHLKFTEGDPSMRRRYATSGGRVAEYVQSANFGFFFPPGIAYAVSGQGGVREEYVEGFTTGICSTGLFGASAVDNMQVTLSYARTDWRGMLLSYKSPEGLESRYEYQEASFGGNGMYIGQLGGAVVGPQRYFSSPKKLGMTHVSAPMAPESTAAPSADYVLKFEYDPEFKVASVSSADDLLENTYLSSKYRSAVYNRLNETAETFYNEHGQPYLSMSAEQ